MIEFAKFNLSLRPYETSKPFHMVSSEGDRYLDFDEYDSYRTAQPRTVILNMSLDGNSDVDLAIFSDYFEKTSRMEGTTKLLIQAQEFDLDYKLQN